MYFDDSRSARHLVREDNPIELAPYGLGEIADTVYLTDKRLARIDRLRLLTDRGGYPVWDVSYCWGTLKDGTRVRVDLPVHQFSRKNLKGEIIAMCKEAGVYAKGLGLLDDDTYSKLWG